MRLAMLGASLLCLGAVSAAEPLVIDDFESGVGRWQRVEGTRPAGLSSLLNIAAAAEAKVGDGAARLRFEAMPESWAHAQMPIAPGDWAAVGAEAIRLQLRGDGSGETLNVMFGNYELRPPLSYRLGVKLDFTGWREVTLPFRDFQPAGLPDNLRKMVLIQLNASGTNRPIDVLVDELVAVPGGGGPEGSYGDLELSTGGSWSAPAPAAPLPVDRLAGLPAGAVLPRLLHGVRNHLELHNPVEFAVDYAEPGTFAVKVGETSGYGGSRLLVLMDGQEVLRRDFPGETQTALQQFRGWYTVAVPAGRHTIRVDNDGADWLTVEGYRLGNYVGVSARLRRGDAKVEIRFVEPEQAAGIELTARLAGRDLPLQREAPGRLVAVLPRESDGPGTYPLVVEGRRGDRPVFRRELMVPLSASRLRPVRVAFAVTEPVDLDVRYANRADVRWPGRRLTAAFGDRELPLTEVSDGIYRLALGRLAAGTYEAQISADGGPPRAVRWVVYDPAVDPVQAEGIIGLGPDGWFRTPAGRQHLPWGFATNGIFAPDPALMERPSGPAAWHTADPAALREWLATLRAYGFNCVRLGVNIGGGETVGDRGGQADPRVLARLGALLDQLGPLGMRAIPVFWWGHYRNFGYQGIAAYEPLIKTQADWFTNPEALALQQQYVREVVAPFRDDPRVLAWEVMNETYRAGGDLDAAVRWTNAIIATVRKLDSKHLITTSAAEATPAPEIRWSRGAAVDFFNWHAYPTYPDYGSWRAVAGDDTPREMGVYAVTLARSQRLGGKPSILGEAGNDRLREASYPEMRALITRDCLWLAFLNGSPGGITWDAIADPREAAVLADLSSRVDWLACPPDRPELAVRTADLDADLPHLVRYSAWSLRTGQPLTLLGADEPTTGLTLLPTAFAEPRLTARSRLAPAPGYESAWLSAGGGRVLLGYLRNVAGGVNPWNVRLRRPRPLVVSLERPAEGTTEIWDLDTRRRVVRLSGAGALNHNLGETDHDYAVLFQRR